jgi:RimJ/RimL family protein N-acetyltransferase
MNLKPIDSPELLDLAAAWLAREEDSQWLHPRNARQGVTPEWLKIVIQRGGDVLRLFTTDQNEAPIGVVGLSELDRNFRTARIWVLVGDKSFHARGYATRAASKMLTFAFRELGLHAVNTWIVEGNPSVRIAKRLNFRLIGHQRECHYIDGKVHDRLWFDLLDSEHREI